MGAMRRMQNQYLGVDQGDVVLFSDFDANGPMWADDGPREVRHPVTFSEQYKTVPVVSVSLSMWDINSKENARGDLSAEDVTEAGFTLVFKTWGDTRVARLRAAWTSIGEMSYADDWDIE